jgi:hypothetical protein
MPGGGVEQGGAGRGFVELAIGDQPAQGPGGAQQGAVALSGLHVGDGTVSLWMIAER